MNIADTSVLVDFLRDTEPGASAVADGLVAGNLTTTSVSVFELQLGVRSPEQQAAVDSLVSALPVCALDQAAASAAGRVYASLERSGRRIGVADTLIAGIGLARGFPVLTTNAKHFGRVDGLVVLEP